MLAKMISGAARRVSAGRAFHVSAPSLSRTSSTLLPHPDEPPAEALARLKVKSVLFSWTDLFGKMRSKMVPASAAPSVAKNGGGFAGFAAHLDLQPSHPDVLAYPDWKTLCVLPWNRDVAWVACDLDMGGSELKQSPRRALKNVMKALQDQHGLIYKTGVELEFHLLSAAQADRLADPNDTSTKPCYATEPLMRQYPLISTVMQYMEELGWGPYQADHEDSIGQFEINWDFNDALTTADRHVFYKWMVREVAAREGMIATFMPKPFAHLTGNSAHVHVTLHDEKDGSNVFKGSEVLGLSKTALNFCGGLLDHARGMTCFTNPTVNSYKRICSAPTLSGSSWSPETVSWTGNNRTHMVRVPDAPRLEMRLPDASANAYLMPAALLAGGMAGMAAKSDPGPPSQINTYEDGKGKGKGRETLPLLLSEALKALQEDAVLRSAMGEEVCEAYINLKRSQWLDYCRTMSKWEVDNTLDA